MKYYADSAQHNPDMKTADYSRGAVGCCCLVWREVGSVVVAVIAIPRGIGGDVAAAILPITGASKRQIGNRTHSSKYDQQHQHFITHGRALGLERKGLR